MLIDVSYFTSGSRNVLNASAAQMLTEASSAVNDTIMAFVEELQEDYLMDMLGEYGKDIHEYLMQEPHTEDDTMELICVKLKESFADYVFFHMLRDCQTQFTINGLVLLKNTNEYVSPISKQVSTWNRMVKRNKAFQEWSKSDKCPISTIEVSENLLTPINNFNL